VARRTRARTRRAQPPSSRRPPPSESNVACNAVAAPAWEAGYYARLLPQLVTTWRDVFGTRFATLVVQLAAYGGVDPQPAQRDGDALPALRAAQNAVEALPATAVALAIDIGNMEDAAWPCNYRGGIHPRNKTEVGRRLALKLAELEGVLPPGAVAGGPAVGTSSVDAAGVDLVVLPASAPGGALALAPTEDCAAAARVADVGACCQAAGAAAGANASFPFELQRAGGYVLAVATVVAGGVRVEPLDMGVAGPFTGVRYARQGFPACALVNGQGLPMAPFVLDVTKGVAPAAPAAARAAATPQNVLWLPLGDSIVSRRAL